MAQKTLVRLVRITAFEYLIIVIAERRKPSARSCVGEQPVDRAKVALGGIDGRAELRPIGYVGRRACGEAAFAHNRVGRVLETRLVARHQKHFGAAAREHRCGRPADSRGGARDKHVMTLQSAHA